MALVFLDNENGFQSQPVQGYFFGGKGGRSDAHTVAAWDGEGPFSFFKRITRRGGRILKAVLTVTFPARPHEQRVQGLGAAPRQIRP